MNWEDEIRETMMQTFLRRSQVLNSKFSGIMNE